MDRNLNIWMAAPNSAVDLSDIVGLVQHGEKLIGKWVTSSWSENQEQAKTVGERVWVSFEIPQEGNPRLMKFWNKYEGQLMIGWNFVSMFGSECIWGNFAPTSRIDTDTTSASWAQVGSAYQGRSFGKFVLNASSKSYQLPEPLDGGTEFIVAVTSLRGVSDVELRIGDGQSIGTFHSRGFRSHSGMSGTSLTTPSVLSGDQEVTGFYYSGSEIESGELQLSTSDPKRPSFSITFELDPSTGEPVSATLKPGESAETG